MARPQMRIWDLRLALLKAKAEPGPRWGTGGGQAGDRQPCRLSRRWGCGLRKPPPASALMGGPRVGCCPQDHQARSLRTLSARSG